MGHGLFSAHNLALAFGVLANAISFFVYLSPLLTFWRIIKKKSTDGFQSFPYSVALFSAMLYLYYAFVKQNDRTLLITINSFGSVIETTYLTIYMIFATKQARMQTAKLLILFNLLAYGLIILFTMLFLKGKRRTDAVGWICSVFSLCVFAAPLSIMRRVIRTKSVEFMPFGLSFTLTLTAVAWFLYGFFIHDFYVALPNVMGFLLGLAQMILYAAYRSGRKKPETVPETKLEDLPVEIMVGTSTEHPVVDRVSNTGHVHVEHAASAAESNV